MDRNLLVTLTADIVAAIASNNPMDSGSLLECIDQVYAKLSSLANSETVQIGIAVEPASELPSKPAVPLDAAFGREKIFCMVCGKGFKTLKRHLSTEHNLKPGQYRKQYGIPAGTALVASDYSEKRKALAEGRNLTDVLAKARAARGKTKKDKPITPKRKVGRPKKS